MLVSEAIVQSTILEAYLRAIDVGSVQDESLGWLQRTVAGVA